MKKAIIAGIVLLIVGAACCGGAFALAGGDIHKLGAATYETNTYTPEGAFAKINIDTLETDIELKLAEDGVCRVVCFEDTKAKHSVTVENGTLVVRQSDERRWFEWFGFFKKSTSLTLYLPQSTYESLSIVASTGDITIPKDFTFGSIDISVSTGDVDNRASVIGLCKIKASTGKIRLTGVTAAEIDLTVSTGDVTVESVSCVGKMSVSVSTGKSSLSQVTCGALSSSGTTGDITLTDVIAAGRCEIERSTGDVSFSRSDAAEIIVKTSTGDVTGSLRTNKMFTATATTGKVRVPSGGTSGQCTITTSTGDIEISISGE